MDFKWRERKKYRDNNVYLSTRYVFFILHFFPDKDATHNKGNDRWSQQFMSNFLKAIITFLTCIICPSFKFEVFTKYDVASFNDRLWVCFFVHFFTTIFSYIIVSFIYKAKMMAQCFYFPLMLTFPFIVAQPYMFKDAFNFISINNEIIEDSETTRYAFVFASLYGLYIFLLWMIWWRRNKCILQKNKVICITNCIVCTQI